VQADIEDFILCAIITVNLRSKPASLVTNTGDIFLKLYIDISIFMLVYQNASQIECEFLRLSVPVSYCALASESVCRRLRLYLYVSVIIEASHIFRSITNERWVVVTGYIILWHLKVMCFCSGRVQFSYIILAF
jgi:hypothetical protein